MSRTTSLALSTFLLNLGLSFQAANAQFGGPGGMGGQANATPHGNVVYSVTVNANGGQSVSGTMSLTWVAINCDLGHYEIEPAKIKEIRFTLPPNQQPMMYGNGVVVTSGTVVTTTGAEIAGNLVINNWKLVNDLGVVTLNPGGLKTIAILGKAQEQASSTKPQAEPAPGKPDRDAPKEAKSS